jgi:aconitate hydratase
MASDLFGARASLPGAPDLFRINRLDETGAADTQLLPHTVRILLEGLLRNAGGLHVREEDVLAVAAWPQPPGGGMRVPFFPARVLLQDFTGVPAVVDLAAMRAAMARAGRDPALVDPLVPCDLVIDHSVQVDEAGSLRAYAHNIEREYERNGERYLLLRWAHSASCRRAWASCTR